MKLSIIIPVYNVEKYIEKCILSVMRQDIDNSDYEIIVVNDGTPDNSIKIVESLQHKYSNLLLLYKENGGLSSARNYGLKHAKGEYVWFIDSDDYIEENVLSNLLNNLYNDNLDFLGFDIKAISKYGTEKRYESLSIPMGIITGTEYVKKYKIHISSWAFICKRSIYINNGIYFMNGIIHEDYECSLKVYKYCYRMKFIKEQIYIYLQKSENSITSIRTEAQYLKSVHSWQRIISSFTDFFNNPKDEYDIAVQPWINTFKVYALNRLLNVPLLFNVKMAEYKKFKSINGFKIKWKMYGISFRGKLIGYFSQFLICYILLFWLYKFRNWGRNLNKKN